MRTWMQVQKNEARKSRGCAARVVMMAALFALSATAMADQKTFTVSSSAAKGDHKTIQSAIDDCGSSDVCTINLVDASYTLSAPVWIEGKSNLTLVGANKTVTPTLKFDPTLYTYVANPVSGQAANVAKIFTLSWKDISGTDDPARPAGWLMWPYKGSSTCSSPTKGPMGLCSDTTSKYSSSGFQHNGMIVVKKSRDITIKGLKLIGKTGIYFRNSGIWSGQYDIVHGLVGVNLFQSLRVNLDGNEISNFFAAIYMNGRNVGGMFGTANPDDYDVKDIVPLSRYGQVGNHAIQRNYLHDNWWGISSESNWDLASRIHHNVAYNNMNKTFQYSDSTKNKDANSSEMNNQTGGFMYMKDAVLSTDRIYNNTILRSPMVMGFGGWRAGSQELFYNNVVRLSTELDAVKPSDWHQLLAYYGVTTWDNTFQLIPGVAATQKSVMDNVNISDPTLTGLYGPGSACSACNFSAKVQYYGDIQPQFLWNGWQAHKGLTVPVSGDSLLSNGKPLSSLSGVTGYHGKIYQASNDNGYASYGFVDVMPQAPSGNMTAAAATAHANMFAFRLNTVLDSINLATDTSRKKTDSAKYDASYKAASPSDLYKFAPQWSMTEVQGTIRNKAWNNDNFGNTDGTAADRGAFCYDSSTGKSTLGCTPSGVVLSLVDQQIASVNGTKAKLPIIVQQVDAKTGSASSGYTSYSIDSVYYYDAFPFSTLPAAGATSKDESKLPYTNPTKITTVDWSKTSGDNATFTLPNAVTNDYARFDVFMSALDPVSGKRVNVIGVYFYRKLAYQMGVRFCKDSACTDTITQARVGDKIYMQAYVMDAKGNKLPTQVVSRVYVTPGAGTNMRDGLTGKLVDTAQFLSSMTGSFSSPVSFETRGNLSVTVTGVVGAATSAVGIMGTGNIKIRPGLPYKVQFVSPATVKNVPCQPSPWDTSATFCNEEKALTANVVTLNVYDKFGNNVDTAATVNINAGSIPNIYDDKSAPIIGSILSLGSSAASATADKKLTVQVSTDSTGTATAYMYADPAQLGASVWAAGYFPWAQLTANVDGVDYQDSARMRLLPASGHIAWDLDFRSKIDTFVNSPVKIRILVTKDGKNPDLTSSYANSIVKIYALNSSYITLYADSLMTKPIKDSGVQLANAVGTVWVASAKATAQDSMQGLIPGIDPTSPELPVKFSMPPVPPAPIPSTAGFYDVNCDGVADSIYVQLVDPTDKVTPSKVNPSKAEIDTIYVTYGGKTYAMNSTQWSFTGGDSSKLSIAVPGSPDTNTALTGSLRIVYTLHRPPADDSSLTLPTVAISDKIGPKLLGKAYLTENTGLASGIPDTLKVTFSEPVSGLDSAAAWALLVTNTASKDVASTSLKVMGVIADATNPNVVKIVFTGNLVSGDTIVKDGETVRIDPSGVISDLAGNKAGGAECAPGVLVKQIPVPQPIKFAYIKDENGDGAADKVYFSFSRSLRVSELPDSLKVFWGGISKVVAMSDFQVQADSSHWALDFTKSPFPKGATIGGGTSGAGKLELFAEGRDESYSLVDSVGPVATAAWLFLGNNGAPDTLKVNFSEPLTKLASGNWLVKQGVSGGLGVTEGVDDGTGIGWRFIVDPTKDNAPNPGDSIRMDGSNSILIAANTGTTPAANARWVPIVSGDRGPSFAYYSDPDGRGTATRATIFFKKELTKGAIFTFLWPSLDGKTMVKYVDTLLASETKGKTSLTIDLPQSKTGFQTGVTMASTPVLDTMKSFFEGDDAQYQSEEFPPKVAFSIEDSIPPMIRYDSLKYGKFIDAATSFDTLWMYFSEPVKAVGSDYHSMVAKKDNINLTPNSIVILPDGMSGYALFDTLCAVVVYGGDSIKLAGQSGLVGTTGSVVGAVSPYVIVNAKKRDPIDLNLTIVLPSNSGTGIWSYLLKPTPTTEPSPLANSGSNVVIMGKQNNGDNKLQQLSNKGWSVEWSQLEGTIGILTPCDTARIGTHALLSIYIYDKYGTFVGKSSADLKSSDFSNIMDRFGRFNLLALWDGRAKNGSAVASGIYAMRILLIRDVILSDGTIQKKMEWNIIRNIGISR